MRARVFVRIWFLWFCHPFIPIRQSIPNHFRDHSPSSLLISLSWNNSFLQYFPSSKSNFKVNWIKFKSIFHLLTFVRIFSDFEIAIGCLFLATSSFGTGWIHVVRRFLLASPKYMAIEIVCENRSTNTPLPCEITEITVATKINRSSSSSSSKVKLTLLTHNQSVLTEYQIVHVTCIIPRSHQVVVILFTSTSNCFWIVLIIIGPNPFLHITTHFSFLRVSSTN